MIGRTITKGVLGILSSAQQPDQSHAAVVKPSHLWKGSRQAKDGNLGLLVRIIVKLEHKSI